MLIFVVLESVLAVIKSSDYVLIDIFNANDFLRWV